MSGIRVLVGTRKGAFILTSDGKRERWDVSGPHFAGWEMYHLKGSPADPNRLGPGARTGHAVQSTPDIALRTQIAPDARGPAVTPPADPGTGILAGRFRKGETI